MVTTCVPAPEYFWSTSCREKYLDGGFESSPSSFKDIYGIHPAENCLLLGCKCWKSASLAGKRIRFGTNRVTISEPIGWNQRRVIQLPRDLHLIHTDIRCVYLILSLFPTVKLEENHQHPHNYRYVPRTPRLPPHHAILLQPPERAPPRYFLPPDDKQNLQPRAGVSSSLFLNSCLPYSRIRLRGFLDVCHIQTPAIRRFPTPSLSAIRLRLYVSPRFQNGEQHEHH
jgi:hypothetical protein